MSIEEERKVELHKYAVAYTNKKYTMSERRFNDAAKFIRELNIDEKHSSLLDVSCGTGDIVRFATAFGYNVVNGTETQEALLTPGVFFALAHNLPFKNASYDVVTFMDTIEHLIPGDDELAVKELCRVAKDFVLISANNGPSYNQAGDDLHINKRPYDVWHKLFEEWAPKGAKVVHLGCPYQDDYYRKKPHKYLKASPFWRIEL